jgi:NitT/TauT family transport system substrate-binding protein
VSNNDLHDHDHSFDLPASGIFDRRTLLRLAGVSAAALAVGTSGFGEISPANAATWSENLGELKIGYLPITDASPLLIAHANGTFAKNGINAAKPTLFRSWASISEAFLSKQVDVVHLLMPLAIQLKFDAKQDIKVVAWNHTDGSAITVANSINSVADLAGKTVAVPFWYSIHNVVLQQLLRKNGLKAIVTGDASAANKTVKLVVIAPADMPTALANGTVSGYVVAEPFNALAEVKGIGKILRFTGDIWRDHACCVTVVRGELIRNNPQAAQAIVDSIAEAQTTIRKNRPAAAQTLSTGGYLPQALPAITKALTGYNQADYPTAIQHPEWKIQRVGFHPFPFPGYTTKLIEQLQKTVIDGDSSFLGKIKLKYAHKTLVAVGLAEKAIAKNGGPSAYGLSRKYTRNEMIRP